MKKFLCFFLGLLMLLTYNVPPISAYSIPEKEEIEEIQDARDCETFYDFSKYMKDNYNIEVDRLLSGCNFNTVKTAAAGIEYTINTYPALKGRIKEFKLGYYYDYALGTTFDGTVYFFSNFFSKSDKYIEDLLTKAKKNKTKYHPTNCENVFCYGMHEAAHLLTGLILEEENIDYESYMSNIQKAKDIVKEALEGASYSMQKQKMYEISQYAAISEVECIAEAICDHLINAEEAAELSIKIAEAFEKYKKTSENSDVSFY